MNIYQCEKKAQEIGFDKARFVALFPCGPMSANGLMLTWAYLRRIILAYPVVLLPHQTLMHSFLICTFLNHMWKTKHERSS